MASTLLTPEQALEITRAHWQVENGLHWMLDVHLNEDLSRARKDNAPANLAIITRNILQRIDVDKTPISHRIKKCAWNDDYLVNALAHMRLPCRKRGEGPSGPHSVFRLPLQRQEGSVDA